MPNNSTSLNFNGEIMQNQIQFYHDLTAFWLDKEWKTPREKKLEKKLEELSKRLDSLEKRVSNASQVVRTLLGYNYLSFHCLHCGKQAHVAYDEEHKIYRCQNCESEIF